MSVTHIEEDSVRVKRLGFHIKSKENTILGFRV